MNTNCWFTRLLACVFEISVCPTFTSIACVSSSSFAPLLASFFLPVGAGAGVEAPLPVSLPTGLHPSPTFQGQHVTYATGPSAVGSSLLIVLVHFKPLEVAPSAFPGHSPAALPQFCQFRWPFSHLNKFSKHGHLTTAVAPLSM